MYSVIYAITLQFLKILSLTMYPVWKENIFLRVFDLRVNKPYLQDIKVLYSALTPQAFRHISAKKILYKHRLPLWSRKTT